MYNPFSSRLLILSLLISIDLFSFNPIEENKQNRILPNIRKIEKNNKKVSFTGSIKLPENLDCPYLYLCYNGKLIKIKNENLSSFIIKDFDNNQIHLLIVSPENIISKSDEDNTIFNFQLKKKSKYKFFNLIKVYNNNKDLTWIIEEAELKNLEVPLNTLIILLDPNSIDFMLENKSWKKDSSAIELPKIIIKSVKDKSKFEKSCLAFMDIKPFHIEQEKKEFIKDNVKLCMLI